MSFCAVCTVDLPHGGVIWEDDGKTFEICRACAFEYAREGHGIERAYEGGGPSMSGAEATRGARKVEGKGYDTLSERLRDPMGAYAARGNEASEQTARRLHIRKADK